MAELPSRTTVPAAAVGLRRPILIAGLLGGILGGGGSFAASHFIKPASPPKVPTAKELAAKEAREIVEEYLAILKADKKEEFIAQVKKGQTYMPDQTFAEVKKRFENSRIVVLQTFGSSLHEFELLHETASSPDLIQFVYLEKFERGPIVWRFIMYRGKDSWKLAYLNWFDDANTAFVP
jgi:hypothetical protein